MLAIVESAKGIRSPVLYNEEKVEEKQAIFLDAHNFLQEKEDLTIHDKLDRFSDLMDRNERSKKHVIHFSVNFSPKDELSDKQMVRIAADFMRSIEFGDQPWLLYRHIDVGHPHMHIVTTNIRPDGSRIKNDLRSPHHLKQVCSEVGEHYHLTPVSEMPHLSGKKDLEQNKQQDKRNGPQRITYGEKPTRTSIAEVLEYVNKAYAYGSFDAYNAVLNTYNIRADRGREDSQMYQSKGLYYRLIDEDGKKLGAPIKASAFHLPVTMERLEEKFQVSKQRLQEAAGRVETWVHYALFGRQQPYSIEQFSEELRRQHIRLVVPAQRYRNERGWQQRTKDLVDPRRSAEEKPAIKPDDGHGFFYIDYRTKNVYADTELGESCIAANILKQKGIEQEIRRLCAENYFELSNAQKIILRPDYPDIAETRRLLLQLSPGQSNIAKQQMELKEELDRKHGHDLGYGL